MYPVLFCNLVPASYDVRSIFNYRTVAATLALKYVIPGGLRSTKPLLVHLISSLPLYLRSLLGLHTSVPPVNIVTLSC